MSDPSWTARALARPDARDETTHDDHDGGTASPSPDGCRAAPTPPLAHVLEVDPTTATSSGPEAGEVDAVTARSAHIVEAGGYVRHRDGVRRVPTNHLGVWCELCEWSVTVPRSHGWDYADNLRREHLGTAHLSSLIAGAAVLDPELRSPWAP